MAQINVLRVEDAVPFKTIAQILNDVFQEKTRGGEAFKQYMRGSKVIRPDKIAVFFHLAEAQSGGGWLPANQNDTWINIPDKGGEVFTQIQLNKEDDSYFENSTKDENAEWAVFMHKKGPDGAYAYYFYGIFKRTNKDKRGVCIFIRTASDLKTADW